MGFTFLVPE
ncbi:hypothetical protein LINPERHAP1_LOCUS7403 [Linum perenne]